MSIKYCAKNANVYRFSDLDQDLMHINIFVMPDAHIKYRIRLSSK